jgi:hypothetical protein
LLIAALAGITEVSFAKIVDGENGITFRPRGSLERCFARARRFVSNWTWPDDTGHIWEALSPHLSCIHKQLKMKASIEETSVEV